MKGKGAWQGEVDEEKHTCGNAVYFLMIVDSVQGERSSVSLFLSVLESGLLDGIPQPEGCVLYDSHVNGTSAWPRGGWH